MKLSTTEISIRVIGFSIPWDGMSYSRTLEVLLLFSRPRHLFAWTSQRDKSLSRWPGNEHEVIPVAMADGTQIREALTAGSRLPVPQPPVGFLALLSFIPSLCLLCRPYIVFHRKAPSGMLPFLVGGTSD